MVENMAKLLARFPLCSRVSRRISGCCMLCFMECLNCDSQFTIIKFGGSHYRTFWIGIQNGLDCTVISFCGTVLAGCVQVGWQFAYVFFGVDLIGWLNQVGGSVTNSIAYYCNVNL
jgi:hypothetical protein